MLWERLVFSNHFFGVNWSQIPLASSNELRILVLIHLKTKREMFGKDQPSKGSSTYRVYDRYPQLKKMLHACPVKPYAQPTVLAYIHRAMLFLWHSWHSCCFRTPVDRKYDHWWLGFYMNKERCYFSIVMFCKINSNKIPFMFWMIKN